MAFVASSDDGPTLILQTCSKGDGDKRSSLGIRLIVSWARQAVDITIA
jgi:hypothetical protein